MQEYSEKKNKDGNQGDLVKFAALSSHVHKFLKPSTSRRDLRVPLHVHQLVSTLLNEKEIKQKQL